MNRFNKITKRKNFFVTSFYFPPQKEEAKKKISSRLETLFIGDIATKVLEYYMICPEWMMKGSPITRHVLPAVAIRKNTLRALHPAG
jgi:hypothetical protein